MVKSVYIKNIQKYKISTLRVIFCSLDKIKIWKKTQYASFSFRLTLRRKKKNCDIVEAKCTIYWDECGFCNDSCMRV